jgi:hypothetical protein
MAIVVEEERTKSHVFAIAGWLVFLIMLAAAGYYLFFASPSTTSVPPSGGLGSIAPLAASPVQPQSVEQNPTLTALHTTIVAPTSTGPAAVGRSNPFLVP